MRQGAVILGALRYEFAMQVRRWVAWLVMLVPGAIYIRTFANRLGEPAVPPAGQVVVYWALLLQIILPIAFGVLLADRLARDKRTRVNELFATLPAGTAPRLVGKYLGSALATAVPFALVYAIGVGMIVARAHDPSVIPLALAAFAAITVPGLLFVGAFSVACPAVLPVPLYQFLFVGYWFWGNMLSPGRGIPTISATPLTPLGQDRAFGFFRLSWGVLSWSGVPATQYTVGLALTSTALMLLGAALALVAAWRYLEWQRARM